MNHPADHPVFANMPNTQARLRATVCTVSEADGITLWECECTECKRIAAQGRAEMGDDQS